MSPAAFGFGKKQGNSASDGEGPGHSRDVGVSLG